MTSASSMSPRAASISRTVAASKFPFTIIESGGSGMLLFLIDLLVFLCLAAQFAIAGYFLYLVYWLFEMPRDDAAPPALPDELPRVLVQVPVYNEPLVVERSMAAMGALDWPRDRLTIQLLDDSNDITSD